MAISVITRRKVSHEDKARDLAPLIVKLRSLAKSQPGYITGRTFRKTDYPSELRVLSTWDSLDDWHRWLKSEQRKALQKKIDDLLGEETKYRVYESQEGGIVY